MGITYSVVDYTNGVLTLKWGPFRPRISITDYAGAVVLTDGGTSHTLTLTKVSSTPPPRWAGPVQHCTRIY